MSKKTRVYYDTEFLEDGQTIELISIGLVKENGEEYYAVNSDAPWRRIRHHEWLMENVVPHLPLIQDHRREFLSDGHVGVDLSHPSFKTRPVLRDEVLEFLSGCGEIELWAWYGAYDHVALAQLWGRMIDLPNPIPMWTNDLRQEVERLKDLRLIPSAKLPRMPGDRHNALHDAREIRQWHQMLEAPRRWIMGQSMMTADDDG